MRALALPADRPEPQAEDGRILPGRRVVYRDGRRHFITDDGVIPVEPKPTTRPSPASTDRFVNKHEAD